MSKFNVKKLLDCISYEPQLNLICQMLGDEAENNIKVNKYYYSINKKNYLIIENEYAKVAVGPDYNFLFLKKDIFGHTAGYFQRWGKNKEDNPNFSPIGPEILDLEISVNGCPKITNKESGVSQNCKFCYKNNTNRPATNMPFDVFKSIIDKFPKTLTQVAFGITGVQTNPDFIPMMEYCRLIGVTPNFTLSGADLTDELADKFSKIAGAISVSCYDIDKNVCYDTVKKLTDRGMNQVNIHLMISKETLPFVYEVLNDRLTDPRLAKMHAIVFLSMKPKGRAANGQFHSLTRSEYKKLVETALKSEIVFGFDSCGAGHFEAEIKTMDIDPVIKEKMVESSESCESSIFSSYINCYGEFWHCSFTEEEPNQQFIDVTTVDDFIGGVWYSPAVQSFRNKSIASMTNGCRHCTVFPSINE